MMREIIFRLERTRVPLTILLIIFGVIALICIHSVTSTNDSINRYLNHSRIACSRQIKADNRKKLKYQTQDSALSFANIAYIMRNPNEVKNRHNVKKHLQYLRFSRQAIRINNRNEDRLESLHRRTDDDYNEKPYDHSHSILYNSFNLFHENGGEASRYAHLRWSLLFTAISIILFVLIGYRLLVFKRNLYRKDIGEV